MTNSTVLLKIRSFFSSNKDPFLIIRFAILSFKKTELLNSKFLPLKFALTFKLLKKGLFSSFLISKLIFPLKFSFKMKSLDRISFYKESHLKIEI